VSQDARLPFNDILEAASSSTQTRSVMNRRNDKIITALFGTVKLAETQYTSFHS